MKRTAQCVRVCTAAVAFAGLASCATPPAGSLATLATLATSATLSAERCAALAGERVAASAIGLPTGGAAVITAGWVPAAPASETMQAVTEYCRVLGEILPVDPKAPPIRFQLNVPPAWNGGVIQVGGGGLNGSIPLNLAALAGSGSPVSGAQPPDAPYPINRGYAMFGGDSGHQGDAGAWALNDEARENFAHAALKKTRDAAVALIARLTGEAPRHRYFMGQSQGGREALEVAQRYGADYDGIVATAPLIGYVPHVLHKTLLAAAQTGAAWISPAKAQAIGAEVLRQCDALDSLTDGVIGNSVGCRQRFDPAPLRCPGGTDAGEHCLSDAQLATLARMHAPLRFPYALANGLTEFPGYGLGREASPGWLNIAPQPKAGTPPALGQPGTTVQFAVLRDPAADLLGLSLDAARERIVAASKLLDSTNPDLGAFFARGGKLIVKANGSDYAVNTQTLARWFDAVRAWNGETTVARHTRFYLVPNVGHNGEGASATTGEAIPHAVDLVTMMTDWVEHGTPPPATPLLRAIARRAPYAVSREQPLCVYPRYPHYQGGDTKQAASYACTAPAP